MMGSEWLIDESSSFITTWNTNRGTGTTATLALAGEVDATIDWGDDTITDVNTPGPHVHDYGTNGTYTVSVTGSVTAYNSDDNGGWDTSSVTDMRGMFCYASSFNQNLSGWCVILIPSEPGNFDIGATSWILPRPNWGATCPP
jgi:hypothetical protein